MAINRYDNPAEAKFLNTYVPIPFEQLYTMGKEAKLSVDQALAQQDEAMAKWSEYKSPSAVDTNTWYNETVGKAKSIVEEMAANPDLIKTAEGRARLQSTIRNVDREKLSTLLQSRDNMLSRQKMNQELMIRGAYDPDWHGVDFLNYDSSKTGTFNDVSPLAYKSIQDLTDPYYKGIQDSFLESKGGYDYTGVTKDMIANIADTNLSGIMNTPEAQKHMDIYKQRTGASDDQAKEWLRERVIQDNLKYERVNREENKFALQRQALAARETPPPTPKPSKSETIMSDLGLAKMRALGIDEKYASFIDPTELTNKYNEAYNNAMISAAKDGNTSYLKKLWDKSAVNIEQQALINYYYPDSEGKAGVVLKDAKGTFPGISMPYIKGRQGGLIPLTKDGIPASEVSAAFLSNNENDWGTKIGGKDGKESPEFEYQGAPFPNNTSATAAAGIGLDRLIFGTPKQKTLPGGKTRGKVALEKYSGIVSDLYNDISDGTFNPEASTVEYQVDGYAAPIVRGKMVVSETQIDNFIDKNADRFGGLSKSEVKNLLVNGIGKEKKHAVMDKYKGKIIKDDVEMEGNYYILHAALPLFDTPNKTSSFDQLSTKSFRGTGGTREEYNRQVDSAYSKDDSWFNAGPAK